MATYKLDDDSHIADAEKASEALREAALLLKELPPGSPVPVSWVVLADLAQSYWMRAICHEINRFNATVKRTIAGGQPS